MPHDRNGKLLAVGDLVLVPCRVLQIHQTVEFCNVTLETRQPMYPSSDATVFHVNSRQVVREGRISHTYREVAGAAAPEEP